MNISPVSNATTKMNNIKLTPSFGLAQLSKVGREAADAFSFQTNEFLNPEMFKSQGLFKNAAIADAYLNGDDDFSTICQKYGCSKNPKANAEFIEHQILSKKAQNSLTKASKEKQKLGYAALSGKEYKDALVVLYQYNFDNPQLSLDKTKGLLELIKSSIGTEDYVKHIGVLEA